jgi:hypothetical protein
MVHQMMNRIKKSILALLISLCLPLAAQNPLQVLPLPIFHPFDANGYALAGGKLYTYTAGTSTALATYTDATGATPNANPVVLDATGSAKVFLGVGVFYKLVLQNSLGVQQWSIDNISGTSALFGSAAANHVLLGNGSAYVDSASIPYSIISGIPALNYQSVKVNEFLAAPAAAINFSSLFTKADGTGETNIGLTATGSEAKVVTAVTSGVTGNCTKWLSTGGIGDSGSPCQVTATVVNYFWTVTGCSTGTGQPVQCSGSLLLPGAMPDANYQVFCSVNNTNAANHVVSFHQNPLPITSGGTIAYTITQVMQNGTGGDTPTLYCQAHHN